MVPLVDGKRPPRDVIWSALYGSVEDLEETVAFNGLISPLCGHESETRVTDYSIRGLQPNTRILSLPGYEFLPFYHLYNVCFV
jgi:hypothetical protein